MKLANRKTLGWLLESNKADGPIADARFIPEAAVNGKLRYRTRELERLNRRFVDRGEEVLAQEALIYNRLCDIVVRASDRLMRNAKAIAEIDVACAMALLARQNSYVRPTLLSDASGAFEIVAGRHPVVEARHADHSRSFVNNSCSLGSTSRFALITGPNMGGKSTFLRQNAIIALMAHCGMFVPAEEATFDVLDGIFTRIGARDDVARDKSTFMVEMIETAAILGRCTAKSLVIMDEVGRGTSTEEGFALARGICTYLYERNCRTLFATHYVKLEALVRSFPNSRCLMTGASTTPDGQLVFLHTIMEGVATKSHAVDIARLAGVPPKVLADAERHLSEEPHPAGRVLASIRQHAPLDASALTPRDCRARLAAIGSLLAAEGA